MDYRSSHCKARKTKRAKRRGLQRILRMHLEYRLNDRRVESRVLDFGHERKTGWREVSAAELEYNHISNTLLFRHIFIFQTVVGDVDAPNVKRDWVN
jgi:hypothetical protein